MKDFKSYPAISKSDIYITPKTISVENEPANSLCGPFSIPYHVLGFTISGGGSINRTDAIYKFRTIFDNQHIKMYVSKQNGKEIELYDTKKGPTFIGKKSKIPLGNGAVGIYSHDVNIYIKNFVITLNCKNPLVPNTKHNVKYSSPALPIRINTTYHLKDFDFGFSPNNSVNGDLIKWRCEEKDVILKNNTFKVKSNGVYTLYGEYQKKVKKFFIVTNTDQKGNFVLFSYEFRDWYKQNNPFTVEQFFDKLPIKNIELIKDGTFKDFLKIENNHIPFVVKLNSDIIKHFADYTLSCEIFTTDNTVVSFKRMGFIARLNQKNKSVSKSEFCAATYTQLGGAIITVSNYKILTQPNSRTCTDVQASTLSTRLKVDTKSNYIINAEAGRCFYIPPNSEFYFKANNTNWKYTWIGFDTNIEIPDLAYKFNFTLPDAARLFEQAKNAKNQKELFDVINALLIACNKNADHNDNASTLSLSAKAKLFIDNTKGEKWSEISVKSLADKLGFNEKYLSTAFKNETGITLQKYIISKKLCSSKILLRREGMTIPRVAEMMGYKNPVSFINAFKKEFEQTPIKYIKSVKSNKPTI